MTKLSFLIVFILIAQGIAAPGADVSCGVVLCPDNQNTCKQPECTDGGYCPTLPSNLSNLAWQKGTQNQSCAINNCPVSDTSSGLTGASDLFCKSCPGVSGNGKLAAIYANKALTGCVSSAFTCQSNRAEKWTNGDCLACNGPQQQYATADQSGCQQTALSSYSNQLLVICSLLILISLLL